MPTSEKPWNNINYTAAQAERDQNERSHIIRELRHIKNQYAISNKRILELGCGAGMNLKVFSEDNEVFGLDGLPFAVEQARADGLQTETANLEMPLLLTDHSYDWIFILDVLEHLVHPKQLLMEAQRLLDSSGKMIINVPNHFTIIGRLKILLGYNLDVGPFFPDHHEWDNPHLRFFTYQGFTRLLKACGLRIIENRSAAFPAIPLLRQILPLPLIKPLVMLSPALFADGFFVVVEQANVQSV